MMEEQSQYKHLQELLEKEKRILNQSIIQQRRKESASLTRVSELHFRNQTVNKFRSSAGRYTVCRELHSQSHFAESSFTAGSLPAPL